MSGVSIISSLCDATRRDTERGTEGKSCAARPVSANAVRPRVSGIPQDCRRHLRAPPNPPSLAERLMAGRNEKPDALTVSAAEGTRSSPHPITGAWCMCRALCLRASTHTEKGVVGLGTVGVRVATAEEGGRGSAPHESRIRARLHSDPPVRERNSAENSHATISTLVGSLRLRDGPSEVKVIWHTCLHSCHPSL